MQRTNHLITLTLIASMVIGGVALGMEGNPRYNTGEALKKILDGTTKPAPIISLKDYQKTQKDPQKDTKKNELETKKKEIHAWYDAQKKVIQSDAEAARKAFSEKTMNMSETEKLSQKDALYAEYKQIGIDAEAKMQALKSEKETKLKALESEYAGLKNTEEQLKKDTNTSLIESKERINSIIGRAKRIYIYYTKCS